MLTFYLFTIFISLVISLITCKIHDGFVTLGAVFIFAIMSLIPVVNVWVIFMSILELIKQADKSSIMKKRVF